MSAEQFPISIKNGLVRIYSTPNNGYDAFTIVYSEGTRRVRRKFSSLTEATRQAKSVAECLKRGDVAALKLTGEDRASYVRALELLRPTGVAMEVAAAEYAEARKILGGGSLLDAAHYYVERREKLIPKSVSEAVEEFITVKRNRKLSEEYIADLEYRLARFKDAFQCQISSVRPPEIQAFLDGLGLSGQSYNNFRTVVGTLMRFAVQRGYVSKEWLLTKPEKVKVIVEGEIQIYTPEEMTRLFDAAHCVPPEFTLCLAIGAFAGLRSSEIERLDWRDVRLLDRIIVVDAHKGSRTTSRRRRLVPISDNLLKWLEPAVKQFAPVWPHGHDAFYDAQKDVSAAARKGQNGGDNGTGWKHNALRHSFISYRLALVQDEARVSLEAGNSPDACRAHYKALVRVEDAKRWFSILPAGQPANVVAMRSKA